MKKRDNKKVVVQTEIYVNDVLDKTVAQESFIYFNDKNNMYALIDDEFYPIKRKNGKLVVERRGIKVGVQTWDDFVNNLFRR